jgi:two-component system nitrogen regulation response regulator GlnG
MNHADYTLTSPLTVAAKDSRPLLALTIAWHSNVARIGDQFIGTTSEGLIELSRFMPAFRAISSEQLPIGHGGVSRDPVRIVRDANDGITICPPKSRMTVELNGKEIQDAFYLSTEQVEAGVILGLGRAVYICIHWMRCLPKHNPVEGFLGVGSAAIMARDLIRLAASSDTTVLLLGETGTGKEVAAQGIHNLSKRSHLKMVSVNMAALNESLAAADLFGATKGAYTGAQAARNGFFYEAQNSTLFLDEIGNTPNNVQPMLLRVLENGDYRPLGATRDMRSTARLITATDQDLYASSFNHALVRRLESFVIRLAPLRARREDIGLLMIHILQHSDVIGVDPAQIPTKLLSDILNYEWPGNIRQLSHVFKRALLSLQMGGSPQLIDLVETPKVAISDSVTLRNLAQPAPINFDDTITTATPSERKKLSELTEQDVINAMEKHRWTIQYAAQELGISRPSMYKLIEAHSQIRRIEQIPIEEIRLKMAQTDNDVDECASRLKTPSEALRRHLRGLGLIKPI